MLIAEIGLFGRVVCFDVALLRYREYKIRPCFVVYLHTEDDRVHTMISEYSYVQVALKNRSATSSLGTRIDAPQDADDTALSIEVVYVQETDDQNS